MWGLPWRQSFMIRVCRLRYPLARKKLRMGLDDFLQMGKTVRINRRANAFGHDRQCLFYWYGTTVRSLGGNSIKNISDGDDAGFQRNIGRFQAARVTVAIKPLVVRCRHPRQLVKVADASED